MTPVSSTQPTMPSSPATPATSATSTTSAPSPTPAPSTSPYLRGNFAPVTSELTLQDLRVRGALPSELDGTLLRNGPNPAGAVEAGYHWFAGDAMLHAVELRGGRARSYRNRWVRTARVEEKLGLRAAPKSPHEPYIQGSGAVNVIEHAGRVLALGEAGLPFEMTRALDTVRQYDFAGELRSSMTAHPKLDPLTGELFFFGYDVGPVPLRYHVADRTGALVRTIELQTKQPVMMHDFAITQSRAIFMDLPVVFDLTMVERGYRIPFRWDASYGARVGVMRRDGDGSDLRWLEIPLCYVFHVYNAYDDGRRIVMDVVEHERTFENDGMLEEAMAAPRCVRWVIDPDAGTFARTVLDDQGPDAGEEFPRIDPRLVGRKHRYGYAVQTAWDSTLAFKGLRKHDFERGTVEVHDVGEGRAASEGVFVPVGAGEDEGYVLAPVYDASTHRSEVLVIDAQRWSAPAVAVIELPVRIPFGFHGDFVRG